MYYLDDLDGIGRDLSDILPRGFRESALIDVDQMAANSLFVVFYTS